MSVVADIAEATGTTQRDVRAALNRAAMADVALAVIIACRPGIPAERFADLAGVTKEELSAAINRFHDHQMREQRASAVAFRAGTRKRHVPVGDPPSTEHLWCKRGSHWVHCDDMGRASSRPSGFGDWCKPCWREYWASKVLDRKRKQAATSTNEHSSTSNEEPKRQSRKPKRRSTGPTCVECKAPMADVEGRPRCLTAGCSIGDKNRRRVKSLDAAGSPGKRS